MRGSVSSSRWRGRCAVQAAFCLSGLLNLFGCAHVVETRTIELFSKALESGNLEQLKKATSSNFEELALRQNAALEDLKILRLPTGELEIVEVTEVSPTVKRVTVQVGDTKQRLKYRLKLDDTSKVKKWVVDDVYLTQKRDNIEATKSVTEQMDLLLSVREFLEAWKDGTRDEVLSTTTPAFSEVLKQLPPAYLNRLTQQVVGRQKTGKRLIPQATIDENIAYVKLPISVGEMLLTMRRSANRWAVDEISISSREEKQAITSTRQLARITLAATGFLDAYNAGDKQKLEALCTSKFYTGALAPANLSDVTLPTGDLPIDAVQVQIASQTFSSSDSDEARRLQGKHSDFLVEGPNEVLKLSLVRQDASDSSSDASYLVQDVTIYDLESRQEKRLSALFTAHALVQIFGEALVSRDLDTLRLSASPDFARRVWERAQIGMLPNMPLSDIEDAAPKVQSTVFNGPTTEVTVTQGSRALTYLLLDYQGTMYVDDVLMPVIGRPSSLKSTLELMLPVLRFAAAVRLEQIDLVQRTSSRDFNRLVWHQTPHMPTINADVVQHLHAPLVSIEQSGDRATLVLGDNRFGAHVVVIRESGQHVIDELTLISGTMPRDHVELKRSLRMQLATYGVGKQSRDEQFPSQTIVPASGQR